MTAEHSDVSANEAWNALAARENNTWKPTPPINVTRQQQKNICKIIDNKYQMVTIDTNTIKNYER